MQIIPINKMIIAILQIRDAKPMISETDPANSMAITRKAINQGRFNVSVKKLISFV
ncbi:hypothetical protein D3C80_1672430 [compost metagenome]